MDSTPLGTVSASLMETLDALQASDQLPADAVIGDLAIIVEVQSPSMPSRSVIVVRDSDLPTHRLLGLFEEGHRVALQSRPA